MDLLTKFLVRRGLYDAFLYNIEHNSATYSVFKERYDSPLDRYNEIKGYTNPFIHAFRWDASTEGYIFWSGVLSEYREYCNKIETLMKNEAVPSETFWKKQHQSNLLI